MGSEDGPAMAPEERVRVAGVLTFRRRLSRKLVFYDLDSERGPVELVVKVGSSLSSDQVSALKADLKLGDAVEVEGILEKGPQPPKGGAQEGAVASRGGAGGGHSIVHVQKVVVRARWSDRAQGAHFVPRKITTKVSDKPPTHGLVGDLQGDPCKYWINTGTCPRGGDCAYWHPTTETAAQQAAVAAARSMWVVKRKQSRRELAREAGDPHAGTSASKSQRAKIFVDWLVDRFGLELLQSGTGVLDVGGGRGEVAFELCARGVRVTLIEPRARRGLSKKQKRLVGAGGDESSLPCRQIQEEFSPAMWESEEHAESLRACSVTLGMHPDQATDAIVDFAVLHGKPFAVVPCCVFPRMFPSRRVMTASGGEEPVELVGQLVEYLVQKVPRAGASVEHLPFAGMNQVVFWAGKEA